MRFFFTSVLLLLTFAIGVLTTSVDAETFATNLTMGSMGPDVAALQQFLVTRGYLQMPAGVAFGYFGSLTKKALARWQAANGISPAVGYFGPISRAAIAPQMAAPSDPPISAPSDLLASFDTDILSAPGMRANQVMLFRATPFEVQPGDFITLDGSGFSKTSNNVYFNGGHVLAATSTDGVTLKVLIPDSLAEDEYRLSVSNALGSSNNSDINVIVKVTNNPQSAPVIKSASMVGDTVSLVGSGFTTINSLITTLGDHPSLASFDGTTLTFRLADLSRYDQIRQFTLGKYRAALWIYIQNEHGVSEEPYKLEITI